jgi:hypothetical protein
MPRAGPLIAPTPGSAYRRCAAVARSVSSRGACAVGAVWSGRLEGSSSATRVLSCVALSLGSGDVTNLLTTEKCKRNFGWKIFGHRGVDVRIILKGF